MANNPRNAELDSILRALAQSSQGAPLPVVSTHNASSPQMPDPLRRAYAPYEQAAASGEYDPAASVPLGQQPAASTPSNTAHHRPPPVESTVKAADIDPRSIISWKPAFRHATRLVSRDPAVQERIRKLSKAQHDHEKQWWQGRDALIKQQAGRGDSRKKLGEILKSVGGIQPSVGGPTPEDDAAELQRYDLKVYHALASMEKDHCRQLAALGIPFFNTQPTRIVEGDSDSKMGPLGAIENNTGSAGKEEGTITSSELKELQRRMIGLLEDLCGE